MDRRRFLAALGALPLAGPLGATPARRVTDLFDRQVTLPPVIRRIATAGGSPAVNAFLFLFGQGPNIVTGLPAQFDGRFWRFQRRFGPRIATGPVVSGPPPAWAPDVEALLRLAPDLCFVVSRMAGERLERAGLPAVGLAWQADDGVERSVRLLGEVFAQPAHAQAWFDWRAALQARIDTALGATPRRPRVLYASMRRLAQPIMVPANRLIRLAGGESVTEADNPLSLDTFPFSIEQLIAWNPAVILTAFPGEVATTLADPRLAQVEAVRNGRVHAVPRGAHLWTHYTPEQPLGVAWLASLLHPPVAAAIDPVTETRAFYRDFVGVRLAPAELMDILNPEA